MSEMRVRLVVPHRHGPLHPAGTELTLPKRIADWLIRQNIAVDIASDAQPARAVARPALLHRPCCGRK